MVLKIKSLLLVDRQDKVESSARGHITKKFYALKKTKLTLEERNRLTPEAEDANRIREIWRNFLVIEDKGDKLSLYRMKKIPEDPMALIKELKRT